MNNKRKKTNKIIIYLMIGLFAVGFAANLVIDSYKKDHEKLRLAQSYLQEDKIEKAGELFSGLTGSFWVEEQAQLGRLIAFIITGKRYETMRLPKKPVIDIDRFHLLSLLKRRFHAAAFRECLKLAKIGKYYDCEAADLYRAAVLLETGELQDAFDDYSSLSHSLKNSILGVRFKESYELLSGGAVRIVRDCRGNVVGSVDENGTFQFYRPHYRALIQPVVVKEILKSKAAKGIRLSIDLQLSSLALESLGKYRGSIVLVKPGTGELLAAVTDPLTMKKAGEDASPAFEQMVEPASIMKLITIVAAFRHNLDPDKEIAGTTCRGARRYNGKFLYCPSARGKHNGLDDALAASCNLAFADIGVKLGWEKMLAELRLFGFDGSAGNPFPLGSIVIPKGDDRSLADLSIGLENTVITPVHAAFVSAVFANGGFWVYPEFVHANDGYTGFTPKVTAKSKGMRLVENGWMPVIHSAMSAVTRYGGTASYIAPLGFPVRMKTGTGGNYRDGFHINYIGHGPAFSNKENIAFCVRVTGKRTSYRIRKAGYHVNQTLLVRLAELSEQRNGKLYQ